MQSTDTDTSANPTADRFITVAIHTYDRAVALRTLLEREGIAVEFRNVNIERPIVSSGVRVRIHEADLPLALRVIENKEIFTASAEPSQANPTRPIIVPVDFSDASSDAAISAFNLADKHKTSVVLLHTYIDPYVAGSLQLTDSNTYEITDVNTREMIKNTSEMRMRHFADRLKDLIKRGTIPAVPFTTRVVEGVPEDSIAEYARINNPFIIVMGTRGPEKKEIDMIGSVTAEVLDRCRFTVLALPEAQTDVKVYDMRFSNVLFFSNYDQQDILAMDTLHRVFPDAGINVTIATLPAKKRPFMRDSKQASAALNEYCQRTFTGYNFKTVHLSVDSAREQVKSLENDKPFDLIVIPNKKKNVFSRLFSPTLAHRLLFQSDVPMLVIPV